MSKDKKPKEIWYAWFCVLSHLSLHFCLRQILWDMYMYDPACEQCKLYDAGREAGAMQVALQAG